MIITKEPKLIKDFSRQCDFESILRARGIEFGPKKASGFAEMRSPFRDDREPSAAINLDTGFFIDSGTDERLKFWDLIARLDGHSDWRVARDRWSDADSFPQKRSAPKEIKRRDVSQYAEQFFASKYSAPWRERLAFDLGVSETTLERLKVGSVGTIWTFPERNPRGKIVGIATRSHDHAEKKSYTGCERALTFDPESKFDGPLVVCLEGQTDTATAMDLGVLSVGRPNAGGKTTMLAEFIKIRVPDATRFLVLADNDGGKNASRKLAKKLAELTDREIEWGEIRDPQIKDFREWRRVRGGTWEQFERGLAITTFFPDGTFEAHKPDDIGPDGKHTLGCTCGGCKEKTRAAASIEIDSSDGACRYRRLVTNGEKAIFVNVHCESWRCEKCRKERLIPKWESHLLDLVRTEGIDDQGLHCAYVSKSEIPRRAEQIRRRGGSFFHLVCGEKRLLVSDVEFKDSQAVGKEPLAEKIREHLGELAETTQFQSEKQVSTSKAWQLLEAKRKSEFRAVPGNWRSSVAIKKAASELGIKVNGCNVNDWESSVWGSLSLPADCFDSFRLLARFAHRVAELTPGCVSNPIGNLTPNRTGHAFEENEWSELWDSFERTWHFTPCEASP